MAEKTFTTNSTNITSAIFGACDSNVIMIEKAFDVKVMNKSNTNELGDYITVSGDTKTGDKTGEGTDIAGEANSAESSADKTYTIADTYLKSNAVVTFTNDKAGTLPTGVLMTVAGSAAIAALGIAGVAAGTVYLRKKKSEEE